MIVTLNFFHKDPDKYAVLSNHLPHLYFAASRPTSKAHRRLRCRFIKTICEIGMGRSMWAGRPSVDIVYRSARYYTQTSTHRPRCYHNYNVPLLVFTQAYLHRIINPDLRFEIPPTHPRESRLNMS